MHAGRTILLLSAVVAFVTVPFFIPVPCHPSKVTWGNFDRIQDGMTEAEVEAILGPPGCYRRNRSYSVFEHGRSFRRYWLGDEGVIIIEVTCPDNDGPAWLPHPKDNLQRVARKKFHPVPSETYGEQWYRELRGWVG